jgi:hypothetical protein
MPSWAEDDPREYWDAADLQERANGRLYISADFALPRDLSEEDQAALASAFAQELTAEEQLPHTLAIHAGKDADGNDHNPHAHLMISERQNDGIERSKEDWFRRADRKEPEGGGAPKSRTFHGREWMENARERWAELTNETLRRAGRAERVDHRSYARQGIDREPGEHYGPGAAHIELRGERHDRLEREVERGDLRTRVDGLDRQLEVLLAERTRTIEHARAAHEIDGSWDGRDRQRTTPDRDRSSSPER